MPAPFRSAASIRRWSPIAFELDDQSPEEIAADLVHFDLIALEFPAFTDGRPYSHARLLRELGTLDDVDLDGLRAAAEIERTRQLLAVIGELDTVPPPSAAPYFLQFSQRAV